MGGHLALLQTYAWTSMIVEYSGISSVSEAVEKTFDGEHPCELCKVVEKSKHEDKEQQMLKSEIKIEMLLPAPLKIPLPCVSEIVFCVTEFVGTFEVVHLDLPVQPPKMA
jgi:hypothetical protein